MKSVAHAIELKLLLLWRSKWPENKIGFCRIVLRIYLCVSPNRNLNIFPNNFIYGHLFTLFFFFSFCICERNHKIEAKHVWNWSGQKEMKSKKHKLKKNWWCNRWFIQANETFRKMKKNIGFYFFIVIKIGHMQRIASFIYAVTYVSISFMNLAECVLKILIDDFGCLWNEFPIPICNILWRQKICSVFKSMNHFHEISKLNVMKFSVSNANDFLFKFLLQWRFENIKR